MRFLIVSGVKKKKKNGKGYQDLPVLPLLQKKRSIIHIAVELPKFGVSKLYIQLDRRAHSEFGGHLKNHRIHGTSIFTYILVIFVVNLGKYTIHGSYGRYFTGVFQHHLTVASYGNALNYTYISLILDSSQDTSPLSRRKTGAVVRP